MATFSGNGGKESHFRRFNRCFIKYGGKWHLCWAALKVCKLVLKSPLCDFLLFSFYVENLPLHINNKKKNDMKKKICFYWSLWHFYRQLVVILAKSRLVYQHFPLGKRGGALQVNWSTCRRFLHLQEGTYKCCENWTQDSAVLQMFIKL